MASVGVPPSVPGATFNNALSSGVEAGIFSSAVPGLLPVPAPSSLNVQFRSGSSPLLNSAVAPLPAALLPSQAIMQARVARAEVRAGYTLRAIRNGEIAKEEAVGRTWEPTRDLEVVFPPAFDYASGRVSMHPGLAALADEIMDRHALTALGNVSRIFGNIQASQLTTEARMAFRALPRMPTNHVRYVYRLAALWQAAAAAEAAGGFLEYRGSHAPLALDASAINSLSSFCALLEDGHLHQQNVVYFETTGLGSWSTDLERVLRVACDPRPHLRATAGSLPGITKIWPDIHNLKFASLREHLPSGTETGTFETTTIWEPATTYCRQHGILSLWDEALTTLEGFSMRPQGVTGGLLGERIMLPLPEAAMQSSALGPALASARGWLSSTAAPIEPDYFEVAWKGVVRYMLWELCASTVLMKGGLRDALLPNAPARLRRTLRVMLQAQMGAAPFMHAVAELGGELGIPGLLGRSLGRVAFEARTNVMERLWGGASAWVQWEEALPIVQKFPDSSSVMGLLKPVAIATMDIMGLWCHVGHIQGGRGVHDALCSLMGYGTVEVKAAVRNAAAGTTILTAFPLDGRSYRGQPVDHLYGRLHYTDAQTAEPVFRISDPATVIRAVTGARKRAEWQWYYSWERDFTFEGILAAYGAAPPEIPRLDRVEHPAMTPSTEPNADSASGTPMGGTAPPPTGPAGLPIMPTPPSATGSREGGAGSGGAGGGAASRPVRLPIAREAQLARVVDAFFQLPQWAELLQEAYPKLMSSTPADKQDGEALVRQASNMITNYDVFQDLQVAVYASRAPGTQCLRNLANWGAELAGQAGNVNSTPFRAQAISLGNVAGALQHCPAITRSEHQETGAGEARHAVYSDEDLQSALKCGLSHAEFILTPREQRREKIEAMAAAMRATYEAQLAELQATEAADAATYVPPPETSIPHGGMVSPAAPEATADFGGHDSSSGGPRAIATPQAPAPQQMRTSSTPPAPPAPTAATGGPVEVGLPTAQGEMEDPDDLTIPISLSDLPTQHPRPPPLPAQDSGPPAQPQQQAAGPQTPQVAGPPGGVSTTPGLGSLLPPGPTLPPPRPPSYMAPTVSHRARSRTQQPTTTPAPSQAAGLLGSIPASAATTSATVRGGLGSSQGAPPATSSATAATAGTAASTSVTTTAADFVDPST